MLHLSQSKWPSSLKIGDVVLINEDNIPRLQWEVGVVTNLFTGRDNRIRSVKVKTSKTYKVRSIQRLHNLELLKSEQQVISRYGRLVKPVNL